MSQATARVERAVRRLKKLIENAGTEEVAGRCVGDNLRAANFAEPRHELSSPARQQAFLLSVMLASPPPTTGQPTSEDQWKEIYACLEEAFGAYLSIFWPSQEELSDIPEEWHSVRAVAMPAFLQYFYTDILATSEQVRSRILRYVAPFDQWLDDEWGLSATKAVTVADWIHRCFSESSEAVQRYVRELAEIEDRSIEIVQDRGLPPEDAMRIAVEELSAHHAVEELHRAMAKLAVVRPEDLKEKFGPAGAAYLREFVGVRGSHSDIDYPTEAYIWDALSLVQVTANRLLIPSVNGLYTAILVRAERRLEASQMRDRYFSNRDRMLEQEVEHVFKRLCPDAALFENVYETQDNQFEHDLIVIQDNTVLIVEAKAAPPRPPFRDPERAFIRLSRSFRSDSGIQHGFEQAARLRRRLDSGETVDLFGRDGKRVTRLEPEVLERRICVCVTRDNFGLLATDLALLLERPREEPYPWVVNVLDLDAIADAWDFLKWGPDELLAYLEWRLRCHGKVFGTDELEFVGYHIRHGSLMSAVESNADLMHLNRDYSDFFDTLYNHIHFDGPEPETEVIEPVMMDLRQSLLSGAPILLEPETRTDDPATNP